LAYSPVTPFSSLLEEGGVTLDRLQIFIAVPEREHVTRAAEALGLAPPSVSAAVASDGNHQHDAEMRLVKGDQSRRQKMARCCLAGLIIGSNVELGFVEGPGEEFRDPRLATN